MSSSFPPPNPFPPGGQPPQPPFGSGQPPFSSGQPPINPPPGQTFFPSQPNPGAPNPFASGPSVGGPGPSFPSYPGPPPSRLSLLAIASMIFGAGGLFTCCCYFLAIPSSLVGIVTGHLALMHINRSGSQLTGKPAAAIGLIGGYLGLLISGGIVIAAFMADKNDQPPAPKVATADSFLREVERKIVSDNHGVAHGNTPAAIDLARTFSEKMKQLRDENFTQGEGGISLSGGNFITYCELRPGQCAFIVHVPEYRKFEDDAKESLEEMAWEAAQETVEGTLSTGDDLAVGMKGVLLFGGVLVGKVASSDDPEYGLEEHGDDRDQLLPFFEPEEDDDIPTELSIELPADGDVPSDDPKATDPDKPSDDSKSADEPKPADDAKPADAAPPAEADPNSEEDAK